MKVIIVDTLKQFEELENRIHQALILNVDGYSEVNGFLCWAKPIIQNSLTDQYACPIEDTGLRGNVILSKALTEVEITFIIELSKDDETWFPK